MKIDITLTQTERLRATLEKLRDLPETAVRAVLAGMATAGPVVLGRAVRQRFTGKGPFPHVEHRLGVVTNRLRKSLRVTEPQIETDGRTVSQLFGSDVKYFGLHEFGFTGRVQVRGHTRRAVAEGRRTPQGKVSRGEINQRKVALLVRNRNGYSLVKPHTRNLTIAARAPLTTELGAETTRGTYFREIGRRLMMELSLETNGRGGMA